MKRFAAREPVGAPEPADPVLIAYDYQIFAQQEFGGISRYYCALATQLNGVSGVTAKIVAPIHWNAHLRAVGSSIVAGRYVRQRRRTGHLIRSFDSVVFPWAARRLAPDIVHETYYALHPTFRRRTHRVLTVFDMIHERFPGTFGPGDDVTRAKACAVSRADRIICISDSTRRDLLERHAVAAERVSVVHLAHDRLDPRGRIAASFVGARPYLLYVGVRSGYKNFAGLARAYASSAWLRGELQLVCFGGGPLSDPERTELATFGVHESDVTWIGGGDDILAALYTGAAAFVYPSLYEGFGIPPLEAMALGCPVVCSNTSSIPEVVGDAGEYFDPADADSIREAIERVVQSSERRAELVALGHMRSSMFSWERCARETLAVYRSLQA